MKAEPAMHKVAILIETKDGQIKKANFNVITAARADHRELTAFLLDGDAFEFQTQLENYGIQRIIEIQSPAGRIAWNPASWAAAIVAAMKHYDIHILVGLTSFQGKELLPRIAARLDAPLVMDCLEIDLDRQVVKKSQFSGKTVASMKISGNDCIYGLRPNAVEARPYPSKAERNLCKTPLEPEYLMVRKLKQSPAAGIDLSEADIIISGGRGMENAENFRILFECAEVIQAAVGASRVAVNAGWVPYAMQVGQTGSTVSPKVYIACGISGSVQHFAGMKTAGMIIAINKDLDAAIIKNCDYYVKADLFEIVPALTRQLKEFVQKSKGKLLKIEK
jgi:electron transfer flavoprotein alpha subunit